MKIYKALSLALVSGVAVSPVYGAERSPINSALYYDIGGGEVINFPLTRTQPEVIRVEGSFRLPSLCEIWDQKIDLADPGVYLDMVQDYAKGELDQLGERIVEFLVTAPATIAVASLQRALPGMYDYSQNLKAQMDVSVDYAKKSCAAVVEDMDNNVNPWSGWLTASTNTHWRTMINDPDVPHVLDAEKEINAKHGEVPVRWFGADRGTLDGGPIHLVNDVVSAGFAANLDQEYGGTSISAENEKSDYLSVADGGAVNETLQAPIDALFQNSDNAANFAVQVLGEQAIHYCEACDEGGFTPGTGLKPQYANERDRLTTAWSSLLGAFEGDTRPPPLAVMKNISSNRVAITRSIWVALDRMPKQDRDLFIHRLISDVAVERTVDKAIAVRQMLKAGISTPDVQSYQHAKEEADRLADQMKDEINDFLWEIETQDNLASNTAAKILQADAIDSLNDLQSIRNYSGSKSSTLTSSQGPIER